MNPTQKIKELEREIEIQKNLIKNCKHQFNDPVYDSYEKQEPTFSHFIPHGSDPEPVYNWSPRTMPRWSRTCQLCGHVEYTEKIGPIEQPKTGPIF